MYVYMIVVWNERQQHKEKDNIRVDRPQDWTSGQLMVASGSELVT